MAIDIKFPPESGPLRVASIVFAQLDIAILYL